MSKPTRPRRPLIEAIEPRLLFSATADIAVFDDGSHYHDALLHAANNLDLSQVYFQTDTHSQPTDTHTNNQITAPIADTTAPHEAQTNVMVFIDTSIKDYQTLTKDIQQNHPNENLVIVYLDPTQNGVDVITHALAETQHVSSIHILTHGMEGNIKLGNQLINENTLNNYQGEISHWGDALTNNADIMIYGCKLAATDSGLRLIKDISNLTHADVAASTDDTGNIAGANWILEAKVGAIDTPSILTETDHTQWQGELPNNAPTVANGLITQTATKGTAFSYTFASNSFNDANGDTLTYTATQQTGQALPSWLTFDPNTRTFSGTPTSITDVHPITIRVTANDGNGGSVFDDFILIVSNRIQAENYNQTSGTSVEATSDAGGGSDLALIDPGDWAAYFGNVVGYNGSYSVDWRVASTTGGSIKLEPYGGGTTFDTINIPNTGGAQNWVTVNRTLTFTDLITSNYGIAGVTGTTSVNWFELTPFDRPTVSHGLVDQEVTLNVPFSYQFSNAAGSNAFESNDTLTYSATLSDGSALPAWLSFNAGTRTFSGTQTNSDLGDLSVRVTATDTHGASMYDDFNIFDAVNNAPVNTVPGGQTINEDTTLSFNQGAGITGTYYNNKTLTGPAAGTRTDTDVNFTWPNDPNIGGIGNDNFSVRWSGEIHVTETGNFQFQTQSDDGVRVYIDGNLVIDNWVNHATATDTSGNIALTAGHNYSVVVEYYESTLTAQINLEWMTPSSGSFNTIPTGNLSNMQQGLYVGSNLSVDDIDVGSNNLQVSLSVAHGTLTMPNISGLSFSTGDGTADTTMVFQGTKDSINAALSTLTYTPTADFNGSDSLSITTSDLGNSGSGGTQTDTDSIAITVNSVNDNPTGTDKTITTNEDTGYTFSGSDFGFNDGDTGDTLSAVRIDSLPAAGTLKLSGVDVVAGDVITSANIGNLVFTPAANANGNNYANFTFSVRDQTNLFDTAPNTITLNVTAVNDAPTVANPISDKNITVGTGLNFQFANNTFNDLDADTLTYSAQLNGGGALPAWLSFNAATRTFSGTPHNSDAGTINIDVTASDGHGGSVTDTFAITTSSTSDISYINTNANGWELVPTNTQSIGQTFTFNSGNGTYVVNELSLFTVAYGGAPQTVTVKIMDAPGGNVLGTSSVSSTNLNPNTKEWHTFAFSDVVLNDNTTYYFEVSSSGNDGAIKIGHWGDVYAGGSAYVNGAADTSKDLSFKLNYENGSNTAPTVDHPISDQAINTEAAFNLTIPANTFSDVDPQDNIIYRAHLVGQSTGLDWITFDTNTRTFGGTPHFSQIGTWHVQVDATDNHGATTSDFFDVVVSNANTVPTPIPDQTVTEGSAYSFQFTAFNNANGDTLTYTATQSNGNPLPPWLSFNAATRTFSGTADDGDVGVKTIKVTADDGHGGTVFDTFDLTVNNLEEPPFVINPIADQSATGYVPFSFSFNANVAADPDIGDTLTYSAQLNGGGALPAWLSYNAATRTFSGTPTNADVGTLAIDVIADDAHGGTITDTFNLVISTGNTPPVNTVPGAQSTNEDTALVFSAGNSNPIQIADVDAGGNSVQVTLGITNGTLTLGGVAGLSFSTGDGTSDTSMVFTGTVANINAALASLTYNPTVNYHGAATLSIITDDLGNSGAGGAHSDSDTVAITVTSVNDAPAIANAIPDQNATQGSTFSFQFASNSFSDTEGDTLTYTSQLNGGGALPAWLTFNAATRTFSGTPANADVGTINIDVIADDGNGGTTTDTFALVIANVNDAPTVANAIPDQNATQGTAFNFQFAANSFNDLDVGDSLTYSAQINGGGALPAWLSFNAATRTFSGTPTNADVGTLNIDVTADDGHGGTVTDSFAIAIANINDAPVIANAIPDQNATENAAFNFQFAANSFNDIDSGDTLTYSAQLTGGGALPAWLNFNAATRTFSGTPASANLGSISIDVTADDGNGGTITDTFNITVVSALVNQAPVLANHIGDQSATEDAVFSFVIPANTFSDPNVGDNLSYNLQLSDGQPLPTWLKFDAATNTLSGTPTNDDVGNISIKIIATDSFGASVTDTFALSVINTNDAPVVVNNIANQHALENNPFTFTVATNTFNDVDKNDTLIYSAQLTNGSALPTWLSFDANTRTFSGTPSAADNGTINIDVIATDAQGQSAIAHFTLDSSNINQIPTTKGIADIHTLENSSGDSVDLFAAFSDRETPSDKLTYSILGNTNNTLVTQTTIDASTGKLQLHYGANQFGSSQITVRATDSAGASVDTSFTVHVEFVNHTPTSTGIANIQVNQGSAPTRIDLSTVFNDVEDGKDLQFSIINNTNPALVSSIQFDSQTHTATVNYAPGAAGSADITLRATDKHGAFVDSTFTATVIAQKPTTPTIPSTPSTPIDSGNNSNSGSSTSNNSNSNSSTNNSQTSGSSNSPNTGSTNSGSNSHSSDPSNNSTAGTKTVDQNNTSVTPNPITGNFISHAPSADIARINVETHSDLATDNFDHNRYDRVVAQQETVAKKSTDLLNTHAIISTLILPGEGFTSEDAAEFTAQVRKIHQEMDNAIEEEKQQQALVSGITLSVTTGILIWSLRASSLLLTLFSMLPLWRGIDPLPILEEVKKRKEDLEQQRKDKKVEDKNAKEVGYLFDNTTTKKE